MLESESLVSDSSSCFLFYVIVTVREMMDPTGAPESLNAKDEFHPVLLWALTGVAALVNFAFVGLIAYFR